MKWLYLLASVVFEILATTWLKLSSNEDSNSLYYLGAMLVSYILCFLFLRETMKYFEVGPLYAIWSGLGIVMIAGIGFLFFGDSLTPVKVCSLLMIILGMIGLQLSGISQ